MNYLCRFRRSAKLLTLTSCCERSWWKVWVYSVFMYTESQITCGLKSLTNPYGTHQVQLAAKGLCSTRLNTRQNKRWQNKTFCLEDSSELLLDLQSRPCAFRNKKQTAFFFTWFQRNAWWLLREKNISLLIYSLRYKDGEPLIMSSQPWNYSLQQSFGLSSLEIRR